MASKPTDARSRLPRKPSDNAWVKTELHTLSLTRGYQNKRSEGYRGGKGNKNVNSHPGFADSRNYLGFLLFEARGENPYHFVFGSLEIMFVFIVPSECTFNFVIIL